MLKVTDETFENEVLSSPKPVVVDFFATWCGPCRALHPLLVSMEQEHPEFSFVQVDIDESPELTGRYRIMSVPTVKLFVNGEVKGSQVGPSKEDLVELFGKAGA